MPEPPGDNDAATRSDLLRHPETGEEYVFSEQVGHLLRRAYQRNIALFQKFATDQQLTSVQFAVLLALIEAGEGSPTEIGRLTAVDPATMRGIVQRLSKRGLLTVVADQTDRRKLVLRVTEDGAEIVTRMLPGAFEITRRTLEGLNNAEQVALLYLLNKLTQDLD